MDSKFLLPTVFRGRNIHVKVIPTVCNLKNMLTKLEENQWQFEKLKQWEKRSYKAYKIDNIIIDLKQSSKDKWVEIIKNNILNLYGEDIGASCLDIYVVGYVAENYGIGIEEMFNWARIKSITEKLGSTKAIYQVGKGDGVYLEILNNDGTIKDWTFFKKWVKDETDYEDMNSDKDQFLIKLRDRYMKR